METEFIFAAMIISVAIILFVISKMNRAIKLLNSRVNIHSSVIKGLKETRLKDVSNDNTIREVIERNFKLEWKDEGGEEKGLEEEVIE